jgi:pSer/pThr/pTyr-binding forkhead associated (FHA) protein
VGLVPQAAPPAYANGGQVGNGGQPVQPAQGNYQLAAAAPQTARMVIEIDGKIISEHPLNKPLLTVGRLPGNDIYVPSDRVSRRHASVRWENGIWVIEDTESLNGLIYEGQRVDRLALKNGDRIYISAKVTLQFKTAA